MPTVSTVSPGARFIDPQILARIGNLELVARWVVEGFINGLHKAPYLGVSIDFAEHRGYMPGDDIRRVDWRLYARTDRFYVKQFEADTNTNFSVLFDVSKSMSFGSRGVTKLDYGRFLAACLCYLSTKQRDRVGIVTFDDDIVERVPPSAKHFDVTMHTLDRMDPGRPGALGPPLHKATEFFKRRSMLAIISDFYDEPEKILDAVKPLRFAGSDVIMFHVLDPAEVDFPHVDTLRPSDADGVRAALDAVREKFGAIHGIVHGGHAQVGQSERRIGHPSSRQVNSLVTHLFGHQGRIGVDSTYDR